MPLRPQSDGMIEQFNGTIVQELAKCFTEGQTGRPLNEELPVAASDYTTELQ